MLITLDALLNADELRYVRDCLARANWVSGLTSAGSQAALVKNNLQVANEDPQLPELRQLVSAALRRNPVFHSATLPLKILPPSFNRYVGAANAYGPHIDNAMRACADGSHVRTDISCTLFLSEPASYEGGELVIRDALGSHAVKLPAGSIVIYPSSYLHEVRPVTSGERLACFMFIQSMVRSAEQRRILFDMDQSVSRLKENHGISPEIVTLTGVYHNLLRQWADS